MLFSEVQSMSLAQVLEILADAKEAREKEAQRAMSTNDANVVEELQNILEEGLPEVSALVVCVGKWEERVPLSKLQSIFNHVEVSYINDDKRNPEYGYALVRCRIHKDSKLCVEARVKLEELAQVSETTVSYKIPEKTQELPELEIVR